MAISIDYEEMKGFCLLVALIALYHFPWVSFFEICFDKCVNNE